MARKIEDNPREIPFSDFDQPFELVDDREDGRMVAVEYEATDEYMAGIEAMLDRDFAAMANDERDCPCPHREEERRRIGLLVQGTPLTPKQHKRL